jgi:hypothetical protein
MKAYYQTWREELSMRYPDSSLHCTENVPISCDCYATALCVTLAVISKQDQSDQGKGAADFR